MIPADVAVPVGALCAVGGFIVGYWLSRLLGLREVAKGQADVDRAEANAQAWAQLAVRRQAVINALEDRAVSLNSHKIRRSSSNRCPCATCKAAEIKKLQAQLALAQAEVDLPDNDDGLIADDDGQIVVNPGADCDGAEHTEVAP